jgi:hypothetical protein
MEKEAEFMIPNLQNLGYPPNLNPFDGYVPRRIMGSARKYENKLFSNSKYYIETLCTIIDKDRNEIPFIFNPSQVRFYRERTTADIILKPRQVGFTTENLALDLHDTMTVPNTVSYLVAQTEKDASDLFERVLFMYSSIPDGFKPRARRGGTKKEIYFDKINSKYAIGSAEAKDFGRSKTINNLLISEASHPYWKKELLDGLLESVPRSGRITIESTARGEGGPFYEMYFAAKKGLTKYKSHYFRWFEHPEYREPLLPGEKKQIMENLDPEEKALVKKFGLDANQIKWRRLKKAEKGRAFIQEYPEWEDVDAFLKSGSPIFDVDKLKLRDEELLEQIPAQIWLGGDLYIYRVGEVNARYFVGADTSEGDINSDYSAAMVIRTFPLPFEQVALLHGRWSPDIFSEKVYKLARAYNYAPLAIERNNHGHAVILNIGNGIVRNGAVVLPPYPNIYVGPDRKLGWNTTPLSKPQMIAELDRAMNASEIVINSKVFISEARKFVNLKGGGMGVPAAVGNDDTVIATAIAVMAAAGSKFQFFM